MKRTILVICLSIFLSACAGSKYAIKRSSLDEFADKNAPELITLEENYIAFKDPLGMVPSSQLVPYVFKRNDGSIESMGFYLTNVRNYGKWLNIKEGDKIIFLVDDVRISAKADNTKIDHYTSGYNSVSKSITTYYYDYAWYQISQDDMKKICNSSSVKIRVMGHDDVDEYGTGNSSLNKSFYENNKRFFAEVVATSN